MDAVGACERDKGDSRPLGLKRHVPLDKLLQGIAMGVREAEALSSLARRLLRLEKRLEPELRAEVEKLAGGQLMSIIAQRLLKAIDPDTVEAAAQALAASESNSGPDNLPEPTPAQLQAAGEALRNKAAEPLATNPELRQKLVELQHAAEQTIDAVSKGQLIHAGADVKTTEGAYETVRSFRDYLEAQPGEDRGAAILCNNRPFRTRLTEEALQEFRPRANGISDPESRRHHARSARRAQEGSPSNLTARFQ